MCGGPSRMPSARTLGRWCKGGTRDLNIAIKWNRARRRHWFKRGAIPGNRSIFPPIGRLRDQLEQDSAAACTATGGQAAQKCDPETRENGPSVGHPDPARIRYRTGVDAYNGESSDSHTVWRRGTTLVSRQPSRSRVSLGNGPDGCARSSPGASGCGPTCRHAGSASLLLVVEFEENE